MSMYINISPHNTFKFLGYIGLLFVAVLGTLYVKHTYFPGYVSLDYGWEKAKQEFNVLRYKIAFENQGHINAKSLFALAISPFAKSTDTAVSEPSQHAQDVPVLLYHGISKQSAYSTTPQLFAEQMFALKRAGYHTVTLEQFRDYMLGKMSLPDKSFLLTFDDARRDSYEGADPILQATGFKAVMFVPTEDTLKPNIPDTSYYLNTAALAAMVDSGRWELGSHAIQETGEYVPVDREGTLGNFLSDKKWIMSENRLESDEEYADRVGRELTKSKTDLQNAFGVNVVGFAYPMGDYGQDTSNNPNAPEVVKNIVHREYTAAFRQVWPSDNEFISNYPGDDMNTIRRVEVGPTWSGTELVDYLELAKAKPLPYSDSFAENHGWRGTWGTLNFDTNGMKLEATATSTGASVLLDGSYPWSDYMYVVHADWFKGKNLSLFARVVDGTHYLSCTFGQNSVSVEQRDGKVVHILAQNNDPVILPATDTVLGIKVEAGQVACFEGANLVVSTKESTTTPLMKGGIGARIWDPTPGNASATFISANVVSSQDISDLISTLPSYELVPKSKK